MQGSPDALLHPKKKGQCYRIAIMAITKGNTSTWNLSPTIP
jgi:hypothetical protein